MRHIPLKKLLMQIFASAAGEKMRHSLFRAHKKAARKQPAERQTYIRANGASKWTPIKEGLVEILGGKCWYTEVELVGAPLSIDHYRPVCDYWWLAFEAKNYRIACPFSNSPKHNAEHGCAGGKGDEFPLIGVAIRAKGRNKLRYEIPVILDPCNPEDCSLLAFQTDGRPILHPDHSADPIAIRRVEDSKVLLNLDHPDFNTKREQLYHDIDLDVRAHEDLDDGSPVRAEIRGRIARRLLSNAPFSSAARFYLGTHRHLDWVQDLLDE